LLSATVCLPEDINNSYDKNIVYTMLFIILLDVDAIMMWPLAAQAALRPSGWKMTKPLLRL
jgi:NADH:ubiquinone oxidoreductase subunit 3 (subunit A)